MLLLRPRLQAGCLFHHNRRCHVPLEIDLRDGVTCFRRLIYDHTRWLGLGNRRATGLGNTPPPWTGSSSLYALLKVEKYGRSSLSTRTVAFPVPYLLRCRLRASSQSSPSRHSIVSPNTSLCSMLMFLRFYINTN